MKLPPGWGYSLGLQAESISLHKPYHNNNLAAGNGLRPFAPGELAVAQKEKGRRQQAGDGLSILYWYG
jgi:hypothetical protein